MDAVERFLHVRVEPLRGAFVAKFDPDVSLDDAVRLGTQGDRERHTLRHHMGGRLYPVLDTGFVAVKLISDRVQDVLRPFSGWSTFAIDLLGPDGQKIEGYAGLAVTGRIGPIDWTPHQVVWREPREPGLPWNQVAVGYRLDPASWDGSDICTPQGSSIRLVSAEVRDALTKARIRPLSFLAISEVERTWNEPGQRRLGYSYEPPSSSTLPRKPRAG